MQNHNDDTIKTSDTDLEKNIPLTKLKGLCVRGSWRPNRTATYWPPLLWPQQRFLPVFMGCSIGGLRADSAGCGVSLPHLISNSLNFQCTELYNSSRPPSSCGRHKSHSFNPSTVKVIFWYSSTGCTCYLHGCISYFDSTTGSGQYTTVSLHCHCSQIYSDPEWSHSIGSYLTVHIMLNWIVWNRTVFTFNYA